MARWKIRASNSLRRGSATAKSSNACSSQRVTLREMAGAFSLPSIFAGIRQLEGQSKLGLSFMVPLGVALPPGMQVAVYPKDMWEKIQKGEKIDETKLKPFR